MANITEALKKAAEILCRAEIDEPRRDAGLLLAFALNVNRTFLVAHSEHELSADEEKTFQLLVARRAGREPMQYITGRQQFYALDFLVTPDVLIPRPETEIIVENALEILRGREKAFVCEVGAGSGCISVSILHELQGTSITALDISEKALEIAHQNAERHEVANRIDLRKSDVFSVLTNERFDLIIANPPYISAGAIENLQPEVRAFEPLTALTDGRDGFSIIEKIANGAPDFLKPGGFLLMEIGFYQAEKTRALFSPGLWRSVEILPDLQGIERTVKAQIAARQPT